MRTSIEEEWGGVDYHVLYHNCNHFTEGVVRHLNRLQSAKAQGQTPPVGRVPSWVNRLAGLISLEESGEILSSVDSVWLSLRPSVVPSHRV